MTSEEIESRIYEGVPLARDLGLMILETGDGFARAKLPFRSNLIRPGGTISGPAQMALADASMYASIMASMGKGQLAVTSNLNVNFLERPSPEDLVAEAIVLRQGKRLAFCEVRLHSEGDETVVAHATGSYALPAQSY